MTRRACGFDGYAKASAKVLRVVPVARCVAVYAFEKCKFRDDSTSRLGDIRCRDFNCLFDDFLQFVELGEFLNVLLLFLVRDAYVRPRWINRDRKETRLDRSLSR